MSFQAYIDNIHAKTGKTPEDLMKAAKKAGLLKPGLKAKELVTWLAKEFDLGHGHLGGVQGQGVGRGFEKIMRQRARP